MILSPYDYHHPRSNRCFCNQERPSKELLRLIRGRGWDAVRFRMMVAAPQDVRFVEPSTGTTVLHAACLYRAPVDIILDIMRLNRTVLWTLDNEGWIPLHVQLLYGIPNDPESVQTTLQVIQCGGTVAARMQTPFAGSALHLACRHLSRVDIVQALIQMAPEQIAVPNPAGQYPATLLFQQYHQQQQQRQQHQSHHHRSQNSAAAAEQDPLETELWQKLDFFVTAWRNHDYEVPVENNHMTNGVGRLPSYTWTLHDLVRFQASVAPRSQFVQLFLQQYPESVRTIDAHGQSVLHVAAATKNSHHHPTNMNHRYHNRQTVVEKQDEATLPLILRAFPEAARMFDIQHQLPLHVFLKHWHLHQCGDLSLTNKHQHDDTLELLMNAFPAAVTMRSPDQGLFPFQMAAIGMCTSGDETELTSMDHTYRLLRHSPCVLEKLPTTTIMTME
jgi:hypothetical protein